MIKHRYHINEALTPRVEEKVVVDTPGKIKKMGTPGFLAILDL